MAITIKCPKCGHENQLGRIFCGRCGGKLEFSQGSFQEEGAEKRGRRIAARVIRLGVTLALLAAIILMFLPSTPEGKDGSRQDATVLSQKMRVLRTAVLDGRPVKEVVKEAEINAYLEEARGRAGSTVIAGRVKMDLAKVNLALGDGRVSMVQHSRLGPVTFSFQVSGRPAREKNKFKFEVTGGRIGHLPLPAPAASWVGGRLATVFAKLERERKLLDDMSDITVSQGQVALSTGK